jgi:hypothetical protein
VRTLPRNTLEKTTYHIAQLSDTLLILTNPQFFGGTAQLFYKPLGKEQRAAKPN